MDERVTNWAGNIVFQTKLLHRPTSVDQVRELIGKYGITEPVAVDNDAKMLRLA